VDVQSSGRDIVMVLDVSNSMGGPIEHDRGESAFPAPIYTSQGLIATRPAGKTRMLAAKDAIKSFIRHRHDDRIALVIFSDNAYVVSPLTFDYDYLLRYVDSIDEGTLRGEGMTAIGDALALANRLLVRQANGAEPGNQVIVLFTDGDNNLGRDPLDALIESYDAHIRVHFVGIDLGDIHNEQEEQLVQGVRQLGGQYFNASSASALDAASVAIDGLEKDTLVNKTYAHDFPVYEWFAFPALLCLAGAMMLRAIPFFVDQT